MAKNNNLSLHEVKFGLALGILIALGMLFVSTTAAAGWGTSWVPLIGEWYVGYNLSFSGVFLGVIYGFLDGFIGGWLLALIYNKLLSPK